MKRFVVFIILFSLLTLCAAWLANATAISVLNSKHNLSSDDIVSTGTGSIKSLLTSLGGTSEVCVFCHTPHGGNTQAPLWNKTASVGSYSTYTSDVLAGLVYWAAEDPKTGVPHIKTRICLSCHDGTIALGSLVNLPNEVTEAQVPMEGTTGGNMPTTAAGYIGVELKDDHPVAIKHDNDKDSELKSSISAGSAVNLYYADGAIARPTKTGAGSTAGYVECTSCHNPHDNQYGKFLVETNQMSALCLECHDKTGFSNGIHNTSTTGYSPPTGGTPAYLGNGVTGTVGDVKCMNCHFPHKAGVTAASPTAPNPGSGMYLLSFREEASCFNNNDRFGQQSVAACHGTNASAAKRKIQPELLDSNLHNVGNYSDVHGAAEARTFPWDGTKHVECADCHNSHTAGSAVRSVGTNAVSSGNPLYGTGGVGVSAWPSAWQQVTVTNYTYKEPYGLINAANTSVAYEYEICFKCHSNANQNFASWDGAWTDQAKEFNPANGGFHPVAGVNTNRYQIPSGSWNAGSLGTFADGNTMYCSDCHGNESASPSPQGPHGSNNASILRASPFLTSYSTDTTGSSDEPTGGLCDQCHASSKYYSATDSSGSGFETSIANGSINLHNRHVLKKNGFAYRCVNCHTIIPHGFTRRGMIVVQGDTDEATYSAGGAGGSKITSYSDPGVQSYPTTTSAGGPTCGTVTGCHQ